MMYRRSALRGLAGLILILLSSPTLVRAQGTQSSTLTLPRVYVHDLAATVTGNNTVTGSFSIENTESIAVGNLQYEISILSPRPEAAANELAGDTPLVYGRSPQNQPIALAPQQKQSLSFTYQAPPLPTGPYRLRVQLTTSNGRQLGWRDATVTLGGAQNFVIVQPKALMVQSTNPADPTDQRDTWAPFEGANVDPGMPVTLRATVNYAGALPLKVIPLITITRLFAPATQPTTTSGELLTVVPNTLDETLPVVPDSEQTLNIPITAPGAPGSYQVMISLQTEQRATVSNLAEFRLVTRGLSASIITASLRELPARTNAPAVIDFLIAGPSDRQSTVAATVEATFYNDTAIIGSATNTVQLGSSAQPGTAQLELTSAITGTPRIQLTLKDPSGTTLDTYDVPVTGVAAGVATPPSQLSWAWLVAGGITVVLLIAILWIWSKRRIRPLPPLMLLLAVLISGGLILGSSNISHGQANGIQFSACLVASPSPSPSFNPIPSLEPSPSTSPSPSPTPDPCQNWNLFVNPPDSDDRSQVPYEARFEWFVSGTSVSNSAISVYALGDKGGKVVDRTITSQSPGTNTLGRTIQFTAQQPNRTFAVTVPAQQLGSITNLLPWLAQGRGIGASVTNDTAPSIYFAGTFNLAALHPTTTIWTEAMGNIDSGSTVGVIDDFLWLTPRPVASPSPGVSPTISPSPTVPPGCLVVGRSVTSSGACQQARVSISLNNTCSDVAFRSPLDVMLVLDRSGSMGQGQKMADAKTAAQALVDQLDTAVDRVGLVSYSETGRLDAPLTINFPQVKSLINGLTPQGPTNIGDGVFQARTELLRGRPNAAPIMIVLTDGTPNRQHVGKGCPEGQQSSPNECTADAINQAAAAKQAGQTVYTIGLGLHSPLPEEQARLALARAVLLEMASSSDKFYDAPSSDQLTQIFVDIANQFKQAKAENTIITEILSPGVNYVLDSAEPAPTKINDQTLKTLTWDVGTVTRDQQPHMTFTVTFDQDSPQQPISVHPDSQTTYLDGIDQLRRTISPLSHYTPKSCTPPPQCSDAKDNDGDGKIDCDDIGCRTKPADPTTCVPTDNDETDPGFSPGPVIETE